jgi:hypothetical protein
VSEDLQNPHYFREKGESAERLLHDLAIKTFLTDWCYPNPKRPDGKELCDLLVVFDEVALIWQVKDLKLDEQGRYDRAEVAKNVRQLGGARRALFDLKIPLVLKSPRRGDELFEASTVKEVHLISVLMGDDPEGAFPFADAFKGNHVHVFTREFAKIVLAELDTIADFVAYLRAKDTIPSDKMIFVEGDERELLASYIVNGRSLEWIEKADVVILADMWDEYDKRVDVRAKREEDEISSAWDKTIEQAHQSGQGYERVARELARPNRFQRRVLSQTFVEAMRLAAKTDKDLFRRCMSFEGMTYCFLFMDDPEPREKRRAMLKAMMYVGRQLHPDNSKVVGIATEKTLSPYCSFDFGLFVKPEWTEEDKQRALKLQEEAGIFKNPNVGRAHVDEFPSVESPKKK